MNTFPDPAGAVDVEDRQLGSPRADGSPPDLYRYFAGRTWTIERPEGQRAIEVENVNGYDDKMSVSETRELARTLIAACDEVTEMFERDETVGLSDPAESIQL